MKIFKIVFAVVIILFLSLTIYYFYPESKLPLNVQIDHLIVFKSKKELLAYADGKLVKTYKISIGLQPNGDKEFEGDNKTPEGVYLINDKNPNSICHKNLGISYPNNEDIKHAKELRKPAGGDIKIHGLPNGFGFISKFHRWFGFTNGCVMVTNLEVDELYKAVKIGSEIEMKP
jgi:murein L,D-transpeptidase YafK